MSQKSESLHFRIDQMESNAIHFMNDWQALSLRSHKDMCFFHSPHWVLVWLAEFGPHSLTCITGWRADKMVFLIMLSDQSPNPLIKELGCVTNPHSGYSSILIDDSEDRIEIVNKAYKFIAENLTADLIVFPNTPKYATWLPIEGALKPILTVSASEYAAIADTEKVSGFEMDAQSKAASKNKNLRRKRKKLEQNGELKLDIINYNHPLKATITNNMFDWKIEWLNSRGLVGQAVREHKFQNFIRRLSEKSDGEQKTPFFFALMQNNKPIASFLCMPERDILHCYFTAFDPEYARYSPGNILTLMILDWMKNSEYRYYDFEGFPEPYKDKLATEKICLYDAYIVLTWRGKLLAGFKRLLIRKILKKLFYKLPKNLRQKLIKS